MKYNLYIKTDCSSYNIIGINKDQLDKVVSIYKSGTTTFTLGGKKYIFRGLRTLQIFTHENILNPEEAFAQLKMKGFVTKSYFDNYFASEALALLGKNVTYDFIGDSEFGEENNDSKKVSKLGKDSFNDKQRIIELGNINSENFDLTKLIQFCNELNDNYTNSNYLSVAMISRSIINHIPPIFGFQNFNEVSNNYGSKSLKKSMLHLNNSMRNIADSFSHEMIRKKEVLPTAKQVDFSQDLDLLLSEIIRKLNE